MARNTKPTDLIEMLGYAPDADPNTPGAWSDCTLMLPNHRGFQTPRLPGAFSNWGAEGGLSGLTPIAAFAPRLAGLGGRRLYVAGHSGGVSRIYTTNGDFEPFYDVSSATAGYASPLDRWPMTQFGDWLLVAAPAGLEAVNVTGAGLQTRLTPVVGSPQAWFLVVAERFVLALRGGMPGVAAADDRWMCSARDDHTSWTASPATLATSGRLPDAEGPFTGAIALGGLVYAFKSRTCYLGRFVGAPEVWAWTEWPFRVGAIARPAHYKQGIVFLARDNLYYFDGASLVGLMDGRWQQFYTQVSPANERPQIVVDEARDLVYVGFRTTAIISNTNELQWFACHIPSRRWTKCNLPGVLLYFSGQASFTVFNGPGTNEADSLWMIDSGGSVRFPNSDWTAGAATAAPGFTMNDFGDHFADSEVSGVRLKLLSNPTSATCTPQFRNELDAPLTNSLPVARNADGDFDFRQTARWHRLRFTFGGRCELTGARIAVEQRGTR